MRNMFVQVNGIRLGIEQRGADGKRGATLVMLHGFTGSAAGWGKHLDTLAAYGLRVIALDLPGHGQSDAPGDPQRYAIEYCQQDILAALQKLGVSQGEALLLGYSLGGRIALYTAFSGFFRALILESASPGLEDPVEREQRRISDEVLAASIERDGVQAFIDRWDKQPLFASQSTLPPESREALRRQRLSNRASGLAQSLRGVGTGVSSQRLPGLWPRRCHDHNCVLYPAPVTRFTWNGQRNLIPLQEIFAFRRSHQEEVRHYHQMKGYGRV